jgi:hypothetical protein
MDVNEQSAVSRQFMASLPAYSSKWTNGTKYFQAGYAVFFVAFVLFVLLMVFGPLWGVHLHFPHIGAAVGYGVPVGMLIVGVGMAAYLFWRSRRKVLITVTNDQLTVDRRPGVAFAFGDAQLGSWVAMGVALHLQCGRHRFLLGGRDRRVSPTTSLIAPPVRLVDAWLSESDFDELLSLGEQWNESAAGGPAPGEPTRCLLFANPLVIRRMGSFAFRKKQRLMRSLSRPQLFIDVDNGAIRLGDPDSNAVNASASLSRVTATPATYRLATRRLFASAENAVGDAAGQYFSTMPAMAVCLPGMQPLTIGCRDFRGLKRRFSWSDNVPVCNDPPAYEVSAADWLTLAEELSLAPYLEDTMK